MQVLIHLEWRSQTVEEETIDMLRMLYQFIVQFSVDTNGIFDMGESEGVHANWDAIAMRPGFYAVAVGFAAG